MSIHEKAVVVAALVVSLAIPAAAAQKVESDGISVELLNARAVEGEHVLLRFALKGSDGNRLSGVRPAAWIDAHDAASDATTCKAKIQSFLGGTLRARPQVDLNAYSVLTLNAEPSVAVIDPLLGFGGSKLLTAVTLESPGVDWALSPDQKHLFVSMPLVNRVAVIDTEEWNVVRNIEVGFKPTRLALNDAALWVLSESTASVIDLATLGVRRNLDIGKGPHQIAFDGKRVYISGTQSKSVDSDVVLVDADALAYSALSNSVFAIDRESGLVSLVGTDRRIEAAPGINTIAFSPDGRWGFVTNAKENSVHVIDSSTATIVTTAKDVGTAPDQISFTDDFAYVRAAGSEQVKMIRLADLGKSPEASVASFSGGQFPTSAVGAENYAASIVQAPESKAVLVANPGDRTVYYYMEGMAAPMGNFTAARRSPKAALVLDRSLRESEPGIFSIRTKMPPAGKYDVAFFLNAPRVVHCFDLAVQPGPESKRAARAVTIEPLLQKTPIAAGKELEVRFRVTDPETHKPHKDVRDLRALAYVTSGWQQRISASDAGDGTYKLKLNVPEPGIYYVFFESPSLHLKLKDGSPLIFEAVAQ